MKISKLIAFGLIFLLSSSLACKNSSHELESQLRYSGSKLHIATQRTKPLKKASFIIYDYDEATSGLQKIHVETKSSHKNPKADIITAFLTHNHILKKADQVQLLKIEEVGTNTHYYLSSLSDLENPSTKLFTEALELTLLRHLKKNSFNIIYSKSAQL
jgi:hypothetical protein